MYEKDIFCRTTVTTLCPQTTPPDRTNILYLIYSSSEKENKMLKTQKFLTICYVKKIICSRDWNLKCFQSLLHLINNCWEEQKSVEYLICNEIKSIFSYFCVKSNPKELLGHNVTFSFLLFNLFFCHMFVVKQDIRIYVAYSRQNGWPDWADIFCGHSGYKIFDIFFNIFFKPFFHGQRRVLQLVVFYCLSLLLFMSLMVYVFIFYVCYCSCLVLFFTAFWPTFPTYDSPRGRLSYLTSLGTTK